MDHATKINFRMNSQKGSTYTRVLHFFLLFGEKIWWIDSYLQSIYMLIYTVVYRTHICGEKLKKYNTHTTLISRNTIKIKQDILATSAYTDG